MKHIDKTPYRSESGEISIFNRVQGMLKYGMTWYNRVKAQDAVAAILGRQLGGQFVLLQNIILPGTEIDLPLVLLGPPGVYLINALHEQGVYLVRDDEWGTLTGETFVPARINQVKRAMTMAKVLQVYLDRMGYKGFLVEPVVMSPDPKLHIDSTRPAARVVMSDAIDRFALNLLQSRAIFDMNTVLDLEHLLLTGQSRQQAMAEGQKSEGAAARQGAGVFLPEEGSDLEFSFQEESEAAEAQPQGFAEAAPLTEQAPSSARPKKAKKPKRKKILGMTPVQLGVVIALLLCWLCGLLVFVGWYFYSIGWIQFA
ncbi:MAG: NERD domain-containing protein [Anaerolineales bacterium]|nr:NERD domain-containing protein [Anaerolineales bacterium]